MRFPTLKGKETFIHDSFIIFKLYSNLKLLWTFTTVIRGGNFTLFCRLQCVHMSGEKNLQINYKTIIIK